MANRRITKKRKKQLELKAMEVSSANTEETALAAKANVQTEAKTETKAKATAETKAKAETETETKAEAPAAKTRSKNMKSRFFVQYNGHEFEEQEILAKIKQKWKEAGNMVKDLKDLDIYVKPEDGKAYYRINGEISDSMPLYE